MASADPSNINILLVDDEEDVVEVVGHFLEQEGYHVEKAYDGEEALKKATNEINLIVLDIMLPGLNGYEVCRRLRSRVETEMIPIVFLSAKSEEEDQIRGIQVAATVPTARKDASGRNVSPGRVRVEREIIVPVRAARAKATKRAVHPVAPR